MLHSEFEDQPEIHREILSQKETKQNKKKKKKKHPTESMKDKNQGKKVCFLHPNKKFIRKKTKDCHVHQIKAIWRRKLFSITNLVFKQLGHY